MERYLVAALWLLLAVPLLRGADEIVAAPDTADYEEDMVVPPGHFKSNHGSSITELPDKTMLCAWYAGSFECAPDVNIYASRFDPVGKTWSAPTILAHHGERADWRILPAKSLGNVALHVDDEGIVWAFYGSIPFGGWSAARVDYRTSKDGGRTWARPKTLIRMFSNMPRCQPVRVGPGRFAVPLYHNMGQKHGYTCTLTVRGGEILNLSYESIPGEKQTQPAIVAQPDGALFAYLRDPTWKSMMFSHFDPASRQWSTAERLTLPNPNASSAVEATPDGKVLLVYNNSPVARVPLTLAYSENGRDFTNLWDFETTKTGAAFSYPALKHASDGSYHLTYSYDRRSTIKHVRFTQKWLDQKIAASQPAP